ncbi:hypothetical protein QZH41_001359 [Actinostola sp. cb2023]|nr:hypothetical protein QZH41_001359 [Actinostola sp. cb2023]
MKTEKRNYKRRVCPVDGCPAIVCRLHNHLCDKHKLSRNDPTYLHYLKTASIHQELGEDKNDPIMVTSSSSSDDSSDKSSVSDDTEDTSEMEVRFVQERAERAKAKKRSTHKRKASHESDSSSFEVCQQSSIRQIHDDSEEFDEDERNLCSIAVRSIHGEECQPLLPRRVPLLGEQSQPSLWQASAQQGDMRSDDICENISVQTSDISSAEQTMRVKREGMPVMFFTLSQHTVTAVRTMSTNRRTNLRKQRKAMKKMS